MDKFVTVVKEVKHLTPYVLELSVDLISPDRIVFEPGQEMQLQIGEIKQNLVIASLPKNDRTLSFCVALKDNSPASEVLKNIKVGDQLEMAGPFGDFIFNSWNDSSVFLAAGAGIAPFCSILPAIFEKGYSQACKLIFGLRNEEEMYYLDRFRSLAFVNKNFKFIPTLSQAKWEWPGEHGRVTSYIDSSYEQYSGYFFYICGSKEMTEDCLDILKKHGHDAFRIKTLVIE